MTLKGQSKITIFIMAQSTCLVNLPPKIAIYVDRKLYMVPCDIFTLNDLDVAMNHKCANISLTVDLREFVYIENI